VVDHNDMGTVAVGVPIRPTATHQSKDGLTIDGGRNLAHDMEGPVLPLKILNSHDVTVANLVKFVDARCGHTMLVKPLCPHELRRVQIPSHRLLDTFPRVDLEYVLVKGTAIPICLLQKVPLQVTLLDPLLLVLHSATNDSITETKIDVE